MAENLDLFPTEKREAEEKARAQRAEERRERREKAAHAYRTISEVADELGVATHVLRFWESKFPGIKPLKRGGGRRYYRPDDVELLRKIRHLLYDEGYTIKGVQAFFKRGGATIADVVPDVASDMTKAVAELRAIRSLLSAD
jgi:DNA-binding transcriptional MerR regulator